MRDYRELAAVQQGWSLREIKALAIRERKWWIKTARWSAERRAASHG